jgi:hypothetical protein
MTSLLFKKQICMEGGYMLGEIIMFIVIVMMFIATIGVGYGRNRSKYDR